VTRGGRPTKAPLCPTRGGFADSTDSGSWGTFTEAMGMVEAGAAAGVGFVPLPANGLCFVDLDHAVDADGMMAPWAHAIVEELNTYVELSPSRCGLRLIARGQKPSTLRSKCGKIELYDGHRKNGSPGGRFLTITGFRLKGYPRTIEPRQDAITAVYNRELRGDRQVMTLNTVVSRPTGLTDADVITRALHSRAGDRFRRLWRGEWEIAGYPSQSEADLALCSTLAFFSGDPAQVDRVFRLSGLMREKWLREDYRTGTVRAALGGCRSFFRKGGRP
jgi:primase-polymerase (primpol)-like protein